MSVWYYFTSIPGFCISLFPLAAGQALLQRGTINFTIIHFHGFLENPPWNVLPHVIANEVKLQGGTEGVHLKMVNLDLWHYHLLCQVIFFNDFFNGFEEAISKVSHTQLHSPFSSVFINASLPKFYLWHLYNSYKK